MTEDFVKSIEYLEETDVTRLGSCLYLCVTFPWGKNHSFTFKYANHCARYASVHRRNFERKACDWNMLPCSDVIISRKHSINIEFLMILNKHFQLNSFVKTVIDFSVISIGSLQWEYYFITNRLEIAVNSESPRTLAKFVTNEFICHLKLYKFRENDFFWLLAEEHE